MPLRRALVQLFGLALAAQACSSFAHGAIEPPVDAPASVTVSGTPPAPARGVAELKFGEIFRMPVGPQGLEPSDKLLSLDGKPVRLVGYMVAAESPLPGRLILSPLPVAVGDADEGLADDLPPSVVYVHLSGPAAARTVANYRGLIQLTGTLQLGARDEADGRVSGVRLLLDEAQSRRLLGDPPAKPGDKAKSASRKQRVASAR